MPGILTGLSENSRVPPVTGDTAPYWSDGLIAMTSCFTSAQDGMELQPKNSYYKETSAVPLCSELPQ